MVHCDLHIHSAHSSDGEFSAGDIVGKCSALTVFALTDHNTVRGVGEAARAAREVGLTFVPGIEIDCNFRGTDMHLLGYGIDWESADFTQLEASVGALEREAFGEMIENLLRLGFAVDAQAVLDKAAGGIPTGELIAEVMLSQERFHTPLLRAYMPGGERSDMPYINFYLDYFAQGKPAHVSVEYMDFRQAVELVRDNGGVPVVAHPGLNFRDREPLAEALLEHGAAGLECFNNYHTLAQADYFAQLVCREGALMSCGSDFHGKTKPRIAVGEFPFDERYEAYLSDSVNHINMVARKGV